MSSDSDDEFSYTNSASLLKKYKNKQHSSDEATNLTLDFDTRGAAKNKIYLSLTDTKSDDELNSHQNVGNQDNSNDEAIIDLTANGQNKEGTNLISNNDVNIISVIDTCLAKGNSKGKKRGKKQVAKTKAGLLLETIYISDSPEPEQSVDESKVLSTFDDVNYDVTVKVWWKSQYIQKFNIRRFEKLALIYKFFAEKEHVSEDRLLFTINERIVSKTDTPETLDLNAATIIEGGVLSEEVNLRSTVKQNQNLIELKIQFPERKRRLEIKMKPDDEMKILMCQCSEELQVPLNTLKFYFDGDRIKGTDTPLTLQIESGECIDCVLH